MKRRSVHRISFVVIVVILSLAMAWKMTQPSEPVYQGKSVTQWLGSMRYATGSFQPGEPQSDPALMALKRMGSAVVPVCLRHIETGREPSKLRRTALMVRAMIGGLFSGQRNVQVWPPAFPDADVKRWTCATAALLCLGPDQEAGVPKVIEAVLEAPWARPAAANAFFIVATNEPTTLPALIHGLQDPRLAARQFCAESICRMSFWAGPALPALTNLVRDADRTVRNYAIGTLGVIGKGNADVVRTIEEAIIDCKDPDTASVLTRALNDLGEAARTSSSSAN